MERYSIWVESAANGLCIRNFVMSSLGCIWNHRDKQRRYSKHGRNKYQKRSLEGTNAKGTAIAFTLLLIVIGKLTYILLKKTPKIDYPCNH